MQPEQQTQPRVTAPDVAPQSQSAESKESKRGGKRPGAGRKPNLAKRLLKGFSRESIAEAVATVDAARGCGWASEEQARENAPGDDNPS